MAKPKRYRHSQAILNLQSAGSNVAKFTGRTSEKAALDLAHWATTDHSGIGRTIDNMPLMGFSNTVQSILVKFLFGVLGAVLTGAWITALIIYGIPFLNTGHF